ncbi:hypothetical protein JXA88_05280 [Candidatus Fermentibacteria bacterium]|nr:hypothetical protein [Candidatus Fermentibacteria bacterium]
MERTDPLPQSEHQWECGFEGHAKAQRLRMAALSFRQKLAWLEEMDRLLRPSWRGSPSRPSPSNDEERSPNR